MENASDRKLLELVVAQISELSTDMAGIKTEMKSDMAGMKTEMTGMKTEILRLENCA